MRGFWGLHFIILLSAATAAAEPAYMGPIPMKNHHPLYVSLLYPSPESALTAQSFRWRIDVNHTNIYLYNGGKRWLAAIDRELTEADVNLSVPITPGKLEVGFNAAVYGSSEGFLDGLIRWWHGRLGVRGYRGQAETGDYRYEDAIYHDGEKIVSGEKGAMFGDTGLWLKTILHDGEKVKVAGQLLAQAPTGSPNTGTGSSTWEWGGRILASMESESIIAHAGGGVTFPGQLNSGGQGIPMEPMYAGFVALEIPVTGDLHLIGQSMFNTSPLKSADIYQFSREWIEVTLGLKYLIAGGYVASFGLSENLNQTAPDFTFHLSLEHVVFN
ncbi:MAG: DUF3187 family protein [Nitrospinae bacterium]|nr:DUF3187 family protein [Nitrospinota bacterium]